MTVLPGCPRTWDTWSKNDASSDRLSNAIPAYVTFHLGYVALTEQAREAKDGRPWNRGTSSTHHQHICFIQYRQSSPYKIFVEPGYGIQRGHERSVSNRPWFLTEPTGPANRPAIIFLACTWQSATHKLAGITVAKSPSTWLSWTYSAA